LTGVFSRRATASGYACVHAAFPVAVLHGLPEAITTLGHAHASVVVPTLVTSLNPHHWRSSRTAVDGLREQGRAALCAAPAVAGWLKLCVDHGTEPDQKYGINEALHTLTTLRTMLAEPDPSAPPAAYERVRRFFDEVFQPYLLTQLVPPVRYWQRGAVAYLRAMRGDLESMATALQRFAATLREETWRSGTNADWDEYTHSEVLAVIGELGPHLERIRVERGWRDRSTVRPAAHVDNGTDTTGPAAHTDNNTDTTGPAAHTDTTGPAAHVDDGTDEVDAQGVSGQLVAWARQELAAPSVSRRRAACRALQRLGGQARAAGPALLALLAELDSAPAAVVAELREEALAAMLAIVPPPGYTPTTEAPTTEAPTAEAPTAEASTAAAERLLALAAGDADASVRAAALDALVTCGPPPGALAVALRAADAEDPRERVAAARVLAALAR